MEHDVHSTERGKYNAHNTVKQIQIQVIYYSDQTAQKGWVARAGRGGGGSTPIVSING